MHALVDLSLAHSSPRASFFAAYGWISGPANNNGHVDIVTIVKIWGYSFGVTVIILLICEHEPSFRGCCADPVDLVLNKISFLDSIGRTTRSKRNEKLENFLTDLQRLTIVHETDHGGSYYRFASGSATPKATDSNEKGGNGGNGQKGGKQGGGKVGEQKGQQSEPAATAQGEKGNGKAPSTDDEASSSENRKVEGE